MKIFIFLLVVFIFLFFSSTIKLNVKNLEKRNFSSSVKFNINLGVYLFGIIKLIGVTFKEDGIYFLFFKIPYKKIEFEKISFKKIKKYRAKENLKNLKWQIERMNLNLKIGLEEVGITVFLVFFISIFFSIFSAKYNKQINMKNYIYKINPNYNENSIEIKFSFIVSIKILNIIKTTINFKKNTKQPNKKLVINAQKINI